MKRKPIDVIVPGKIQKAADVWRMSARWWMTLLKKMYSNIGNNVARHSYWATI